MKLNQGTTYYDVLEIQPNATPAEILQAYHRLKNIYSEDSQAAQSLMSEEERFHIVRQIEKAYLIISDKNERNKYNIEIGLKPFEPSPTLKDKLLEKADALDKTKKGGPMKPHPHRTYTMFEVRESHNSTMNSEDNTRTENTLEFNPSNRSSSKANLHRPMKSKTYRKDDQLENEISNEINFHGAFLQKIRSYKGYTLEELSDLTKVGLKYLKALEEEDYESLPAKIFTRGFLVNYARVLDLDPIKVVNAYLGRMVEHRKQKVS